MAERPGHGQREEQNDDEQHPGCRPAAVVLRLLRFHCAVEHGADGLAPGHERASGVALAERRHHLLRLYALALRVSEEALQAVAYVDPYASLVGHVEHEQAVVAPLLAYAPVAEQTLREAEGRGVAYRRQRYHGCLDARRGLKPAEERVDGVAGGSRDKPLQGLRRTALRPARVR